MFGKSEFREGHASLWHTVVEVMLMLLPLLRLLPLLELLLFPLVGLLLFPLVGLLLMSLLGLPLLASMAFNMKLMSGLIVLFILYKTAAMVLRHRRLTRQQNIDSLNADVNRIGEDEAARRAEKYR
jgi:hypothetical protein